MIRATNHSSFPKIDDNSLDQILRFTLRRRELGRATDDEVNAAVDEVTTVVVAQQSRAFIDIVTDGMVRWSGPVSHLAGRLQGIETGPVFRWFDTNFYDRRPRISGPIARQAPFAVHDYEVAAGVALDKPVKVVLPGPVTFSRLAIDEHYENLESRAEALAEALAAEVADLVSAGARHFQLDEPLLCAHGEDLALVARTAGRIFEAAGPEATTILSTYYGDLAGVAERLDELPGTHLGLDMVCGEANFSLLDRLPAGRGVMLGLFDARTTAQEDAADVVEILERERSNLIGRDVLIAPNAGLELLPRDEAFEKLMHARYVVEKLAEDWK